MSMELLTEHQREVYFMLTKGCSAADIARLTNRKPNTISGIKAKIMETLFLSSDVELGVYHERMRMVPLIKAAQAVTGSGGSPESLRLLAKELEGVIP